jgi:hypothetical protein
MARTPRDFIYDSDPRILQLDIAGNPRRWIKPKKVAYYQAKDLVSWTVGEAKYCVNGGIRKATGQQSVLYVNSIVAIKGAGTHIDPNKPPALSNRALFRRDHNICAYCGQYYAKEHLTRDHVVPTSKGGKNIWKNVVTACKSCNHLKSNRTPAEAQLTLLYEPYAPLRPEFLLFSNKNADDDQREFLLAKIPQNSKYRARDVEFLRHAISVSPSGVTDHLQFLYDRLT